MMRRNRPANCSRTRPSIFRSAVPGTAGQPVASLLLIAIVLLAPAAASAQPAQAFVERPEEELLLLAVKVESEIVEEALTAYATEKAVLVPLGAIAQVIGFAIDVDVASRSADGFFIRDGRRFHLDVNAATVLVEGRQLTFAPGRVEVHQDDIYVESSLLDDWFPLRTSVDRYASLLTIRGTEPLPTQLRAQRAQQAFKSLSGAVDAGPRFPLVPSPYAAISIPQFDQQLRLFSGTGTDRQTSFQYSTLASGDLLGLESTLFLSGDSDDPFDETRLTAGRVDPDGRLLGPLRAREAMVGEIVFPGSDLIAFASSGTGVLLSNYPVAQQSQFDRHTFIGDLPLGWEAELYRNDELVAYQQARADGRYEFRDVPLLFGLNVFRVVFYGPQGQRRTETHSFNVGDTLTPPGQLRYRVAASKGRTLSDRALAEASYGLSSRFSLNQSFVSVGASDSSREDRLYSLTGVRAYWDRVFGHADLGLSDDGGSVVRAGMQTRIGPVSLALSRSQLDAFRSEMLTAGPIELRARTELRISGFVPLGSRPLPLTLFITDDELADGGHRTQISNVVSSTVAGMSISNRIDGLLFSGGPGDTPSSVNGGILVSRFLGTRAYRGEISYGIAPQATLQTMAVVAEGRLGAKYRGALQLSRTIERGETRLLANLSRVEGPVAIGVDAEVSSEGEVAVRLNLGSSFARDPFSGRWDMQSRPAAASGSLAARVFLDANANGVLDTGEQPLPNVGFFVNRASSSEVTDERGIAILRNLTPHQPVDIAVATTSFEDPLWVPQKPGVRIVPRSGTTVTVDFPVLITGEVTGTVFVTREGRSRELGGVQLQLVDSAGNVVKETRTAYDGFYDIVNIAPGTYTLRVAPEQAARSGLAGDVQRTVNLAAGGTIIDGLNLKLTAGQPVAIAEAQRAVEPEPVTEKATPAPAATSPVVAPPVVVPVPADAPTSVGRDAQPQRAETPAVPPAAERSAQASSAPVEPAEPVETARSAEVPAAEARESEAMAAAKRLLEEQRFRAADAAFSSIAIIDAAHRFDAAVAAYEAGRYRAAKELLATALVPETEEAQRYVAKIRGAIVWE